MGRVGAYVAGPAAPKRLPCAVHMSSLGVGPARKGPGRSAGSGGSVLCPSSALATYTTLRCSCPLGIKDYSNWPTIPQVYLNGEFVGGCDILLQMHQNGDLVEELKKLGIRSTLLDDTQDQDPK